MKGTSEFHGQLRFIRLVGDFTHQQTKGGLKKGVIGAVACHYSKGQWTSTIIPAMYVICHEETERALSAAVDYLRECLQRLTGVDIFQYVDHWF